MAQKTESTDVTELAVVLGALVRRIRATAPSESREMSWTQKAVLRRLAKDGATTTAELARAEGVKPQSMGTAIAGLEEMRLVERQPHPTDGRQMTIHLSEQGTAVVKSTHQAKETWLAQAVAKLDRQDRLTLSAAIEVMKKMVEQ